MTVELVGAVSLVDPPGADAVDIVGDDQAANGEKGPGSLEVGDVLRLVGVDEQQVHASWFQLLAQVGQHSQAGAPSEVDSISETGSLELSLGEVGMPRLVLDR